jgi:RNA polymerase sigma factor (sigma-70 family)
MFPNMFSTPGLPPGASRVRRRDHGGDGWTGFRSVWGVGVKRAVLRTADPEGADIDRLYRTERASLVRYLMRGRSSSADAEDMAQEAFLRLAVRPAGEVARPIGYLRQIGRNLVRDRLKSAERRAIAPQADVDLVVSEANELGRLEARDSLRRVEAAMHLLKPRTREVFLAHRLDGMSYAEIAQRTGLKVKRVEKIMAEAIAELKRHMGPQG